MAGSDMGGLPSQGTPTISAFNCKACGGSVNLTARGMTISVYCTHCGAEIDANDENFKILRRAHGIEHSSARPLIPIGTRGTLQGITWEAIGFMQRSDKSGQFKWHEYLLFNPKQGFRWLIENRGHWTLFRKIQEPSSWHALDGIDLEKLHYNKRKFEMFERGDAVVRQVLGEFYWRVKRGDTSKVADMICPPQMLSHEVINTDNGKETVWSLGDYVEPDVVKNAFALTLVMPARYGPGPAQPNTRRGHFLFSVIVAMLCTMLMLIGKTVVKSVDPEKKIFSARFGHDDRDKTVIGDSFRISNNTVLRIDTYSSVNNRWAELDIELVNDDTGEIRHVNTGIESWSGYAGGEYWHEGSNSNSTIISPVTAGNWYVNTDYAVGNPQQAEARTVTTQMDIVQGAQGWSNFKLALAMLWAPSLLLGAGALLFDMNRWELSGFSPYQKFMDNFD